MPNPLVYIIILNWNRKDDTLRCLDSVTNLNYKNRQIVLVDNGSTDNSVSAVEEHFTDINIIKNQRNVGFAKGVNIGIKFALQQKAEYVLLINNDATVAPDMLNKLLIHCQDDVGIVAPIIYYDGTPNRIWTIGGMKHPWTYEKIGDKRNTWDQGDFSPVMTRDYLTGCVMLLATAMLSNIGLFDEGFFMYYEDMDLSLRARQAEYRLILVSRAKAWHKVSLSSGGSDSPNERYWMGRSSVLFFKKHVRGIKFLVVIPYRTLSAIKTVTKLLFKRKNKSAAAYLHGLWDGIIS